MYQDPTLDNNVFTEAILAETGFSNSSDLLLVLRLGAEIPVGEELAREISLDSDDTNVLNEESGGNVYQSQTYETAIEIAGQPALLTYTVSRQVSDGTNPVDSQAVVLRHHIVIENEIQMRPLDLESTTPEKILQEVLTKTEFSNENDLKLALSFGAKIPIKINAIVSPNNKFLQGIANEYRMRAIGFEKRHQSGKSTPQHKRTIPRESPIKIRFGQDARFTLYGSLVIVPVPGADNMQTLELQGFLHNQLGL